MNCSTLSGSKLSEFASQLANQIRKEERKSANQKNEMRSNSFDASQLAMSDHHEQDRLAAVSLVLQSRKDITIHAAAAA